MSGLFFREASRTVSDRVFGCLWDEFRLCISVLRHPRAEVTRTMVRKRFAQANTRGSSNRQDLVSTDFCHFFGSISVLISHQ
jgi:hypothetical protein